MKNYKKKIILLICESEGKCTEKKYFDYIQNNFSDNLKYDLKNFTVNKKINENKFFDLIPKISGNINYFFLIYDNDILNDKFNWREYIKNIKNLISENKKNFKNILEKYEVLPIGIPNKKINFDWFLLMHYSADIFLKNNRKINYFLNKNLMENYKGNEKAIKKIFLDNKDWLKNLIENSKYDLNYNELVKYLFEKI